MSQRKPGNPNLDIASIVGLTDLLSCYLNDTNKVARQRRLCQTVYKLIRNNFFISWKSAIILRMIFINEIKNQTLFWADKLGFHPITSQNKMLKVHNTFGCHWYQCRPGTYFLLSTRGEQGRLRNVHQNIIDNVRFGHVHWQTLEARRNQDIMNLTVWQSVVCTNIGGK